MGCRGRGRLSYEHLEKHLDENLDEHIADHIDEHPDEHLERRVSGSSRKDTGPERIPRKCQRRTLR